MVNYIPGLYRILDLFSEQSSSGLGMHPSNSFPECYSILVVVEKIIVSQESLGRFINDICAGAYSSKTKVDYDSLDRLTIRPLGIYGSRGKIIEYLCDKGIIDHEMCVYYLFLSK